MPNSLIEIVRRQFPDDTRSDEELTYFYGEWAKANKPELFDQYPDFAASYRDIARALRPDLSTEFARSFGSAVDNLQATGLGAGALAADLVGADSVKDSLLAQAREQAAEASAYQPSVGSYRDVETPGDALHYLSYGAGQVAPSALEAAAFAAAGGGVGGLAVRQGVKGAAEKVVAEAVKAAVKRGAQAGLATATIPQSAGEIYNEVAGEENGASIALVAGTFAGLLDIIPEGYVLGKFFRPGSVVRDAERSAVSRYLKALGTEAAKTMPMEGTTEAAQEFVNIAAAKFARGEPPTLTDSDVERLANAGIIGSIGGAMFAPVAAAGEVRGQREMPPTQPTVPLTAQPVVTEEQAIQLASETFRREADQPLDTAERADSAENNSPTGSAIDEFLATSFGGYVAPQDRGVVREMPDIETTEAPAELDYVAKVQQAVAAAAEAVRNSEIVEGFAAEQEAIRIQQVARGMMGDVPRVAVAPDPLSGLGQAAEPFEEPTPFDVYRRDQSPPAVARAAPDFREIGAAVAAVAAAPDVVAAPEPSAMTVPVATPDESLGNAIEIEDFRDNVYQAGDARIRRMMEDGKARRTDERGKDVDDKRQRAVLLVDRATGNLYQRGIVWKNDKRIVEFAQKRAAPGHGKGRGRVLTVDFDSPEGGLSLSSLLNETLDEGSPRFEVAGFVVLPPKAARNLNLGNATAYFQAPRFAELKEKRNLRKLAAETKGERIREAAGVGTVRRKGGNKKTVSISTEAGQDTDIDSAVVSMDHRDLAAVPAGVVTPASSTGAFDSFVADIAEAFAAGDSPQKVRRRVSDELVRRGIPKSEIERMTDWVISKTVEQYGDVDHTVRARSPQSYMLPQSRISGLFQSVVQAVRAHGGDVALFEQQAASQLAAVRDGYGIQMTDAEGRSLIAVATDSILNPANMDSLVRLVHEAAHQFIKAIPASQHRAFHQALSQLPWGQQRWLMNPLSLDIRLLANAPRDQLSPVQLAALGKLTPEELNRLRAISPETLLVEQGAEHLAMLGVDKAQARDIFSKALRLIKDVLLRAGMALQQALGRSPSEQLVRRYVENRFLQFINRDFAQGPQAVTAFRNWIGAPATLVERIPIYQGLGAGDPRVMQFDPQTGQLTPAEFVSDDTDSLLDALTALMRKAEMGMADTTRRVSFSSINYTPEVGFNREAAVINYLSELQRSIFEDAGIRPVLPQEVRDAANPLGAFTQTYLGLKQSQWPDAKMAVLRDFVAQQKDPTTGKPARFDERSTLASLPTVKEEQRGPDGAIRLVETSSAQDYAMRSVLAQLYSAVDRVGGRVEQDSEFVARAKKRTSLSAEDRLKVDQLEQGVVIRKRVLARLRAAAADLEIKTKSSVQQRFYPGAPYVVPTSDTSGEGSVSEHALPLNLSFTPQLEQSFLGHLRRMERWLQNQDNLQHGAFYVRIHEQFKRLTEDYTTRYTYAKTNVLMRKTWTRSMVDTLRVINTPAALTSARRLVTLQSWIDRFQADSRIEGGKWSAAFQAFAESLGRKPDEAFEEQVWDAFVRTFEQLNEADPKAKDKAAQVLTSVYGINVSPVNKKVWSAYLDLVNRTREAQAFEREMHEAMGLRVEDPSLAKDGETTERRLLRLGYMNGRRGVSRLVSSLYIRMNPVWTAESLASLSDPGSVRAMSEPQLTGALSSLFTESVIRDFVEPLARNNSPFISLRDEYGVVTSVTPYDVRMAWERSDGNVLAFMRALHEAVAPDGTEVHQTIADVMRGFGTMFEQLKRDHEARQQAQQSGMETGPRQMMDARLADNWPPEWVSYAKYDSTSNYVFMHQAAIHAAVGRGGFGPGGEFMQLVQATLNDVRTLEERAAELRRAGNSPKEIAEAMGEAEYEKALNAEQYEWLLQGFAQRAQMLSKTIGYQLGDMKTLVNLVNLQATLVLQQPRSALINSFELVLSPLWKTKFSSVSLGIAKQNLLSAFGDTADALGLQGLADLARNSDMARRRLDYGVKDSDQYLTWKQKSADTDVRLAAPDRPESVTSRFFRTSNGLITKVRDFSNMGANDARDTLGLPVRTRETASAKFRPLGVFTTVSNVMNSALVDGVYSAMSDLALRGLRLIEAGGGEAMARQLESGALRLTHTDLGYNRRWLIFNDKAAFDYLADRVVSTMGENSLEQFVAKAWRRQQAAKGGPFEVIDGRQFMGVVTMALSELSLQANMVNTPLALMNSPLARVFSTFLIWPWNAMVRSAGVFRDARGRWTSEAALDGLTVVMMGVVPATLAASFVVDLYDEKVLGKRSNMRELPADAVLPGAALAHPMASLERLARYGAFGLASEAVNGVLNFDDARGGFSADNRIFILNQLNSFRYLIGNLYQQEGNFTYQSAGRPLLQFVGMNGPLQYLQLVSNQLGVENAETQVNARINSGNYLRAAGRALDLDVRVMRGPQSIPTPMTPYIQQMELAALTGDSAMFQSAYARAIQEASQEGKAEPVKYVQQAFADRHPLRRIFRTVPSQIEYRQMVGSMNESGRESVSRAVLAYNSYLQRLGLKPVTGRDEQKVAPAGARPMSLGEARAAAAAASYGYGP